MKKAVELYLKDWMPHLSRALGEFKELKMVVFCWPHDPEVLDQICVELGCRVQCISGNNAGCDTYAAVGARWETEQDVGYDVVPASGGEGVRRLVEVRPGGGGSA
jgi:hypothetical protein